MASRKTKDTKKEKTAISPSVPLDVQTSNIANSLIRETDIDKVKDLTNLFNLNQRKKNVLRLLKYNGLLDTISDQMIERFEKKADEFSNADLLDYMQTIQTAIEKAQKSIDLVSETPAIQLNQNNVTVNVTDNFDRESKERIANAVKSILARMDIADMTEADDKVIDITNEVKETSEENDG